MSKKIILIPIETSSRELIYKIFLCNILSEKNFECYLGKKTDILKLTEKLKHFIYLDKGFHKGVSEDLYKKIKLKSGYIINLDEEGAVAFPDGSPLHLRYSKDALINYNKTFFWGNNQLNFVKEDIPNYNESIATGHPRFQLLKPDYKYLFQDEVSKIKAEYKEFILVNTNFARGNNIRGVEAARKNYIGRYKNIDTRIKNDNIKLEKFTSLVKRLLNKKYKVVIRPHPEEDIRTYKKIFSDYKNVHITNEKSAICWIIACKVLIHSDCTTGVESLMLGKKSISFVHDELDKSVLTILPQKASYVLNTEEKILNFIDNEDYLKPVVYNDYPWLENHFCFNSNSFELIANVIEKINLKSEKLVYNIKTSFLKTRAKNLIKKIIGRRDSLIDQKLQDFNKKNINRIHKNIIRNNNNYDSIKIEMITENLFRFQNNK